VKAIIKKDKKLFFTISIKLFISFIAYIICVAPKKNPIKNVFISYFVLMFLTNKRHKLKQYPYKIL
jgi:hypothetical protein